MKQLTKLMTRLRRRKPRRQDKHGSSMALVMIITSALVIWVMCLAPLMATTGTAALKVQNGYTDYLSSRSAIEYAKSELELIVRDEVPYTFAVIKQSNGTYTTYTAIPKVNEDNFNNPLYKDYVSSPSLSDDKPDVPNMGNKGADVAAICAVTPPVVGGTEYKIQITTYNNGVKALSFNVIYTLNGSLLIYPEAYKQTDALPINDFVLVDGIMGGKYDANGNWVANTIWNSGITESTAESLDFTETMLPFLENPANGYADAREYPAVFKTTALPAKYEAGTTEVLKDPIKDEPYTSEEWILPFGAYENGTPDTSTVGAVYLKEDNDKFYVYMCVGESSEQNITSSFTALHANGTTYYKSNNRNYFSLPKGSEAYAVTADYSGTGAYNKDAAYNALPRSGMTVYRYSGIEAKYQSKETLAPNVSAEFSGNTLIVTINNVSGAKYYSTAKPNQWSTSNRFTIENPTGVYYFYAYMPAQIGSDGKVTTSEVTYAGAVSTYKADTPKEGEGTYLLVNSNGAAMKSSGDTSVTAEMISVEGSNPASVGAIVINPNNTDYTRFKWTAKREDDSIDLYQYLSRNNRYVTFNGDYLSSNSSWSYSVNLNTRKDTLTLDSSKNTLYQEITDTYTTGSGCSTVQNEVKATAYLNIANGDVSLTNSSTPAVYFIDASVLSTSAPIPSSIPAPTESFYSEYPENIAWDSLYANGKEVEDKNISNLAPGSYILSGKAQDGKLLMPNLIHIYKNDYATNPVSITSIKQDDNDDSKITVTAETTSKNQLYIGYQVVNSNTEIRWNDYFWFPAEGNTVTFCLPIGENIQYSFAALDVGDSTTAQATQSQVESFAFADLTEYTFRPIDFMYYLKEDSSQDAGYSIFWYKMPTDEGVWPRKVHLKFKVAGEWQDSPGAEIDEYGITIDGSLYTGDNVLVLSNPVGLTTENDRTSSMLSGASLYFMGGIDGSPSIDTYNNAIYLTTDLLVLNGDMKMTCLEENLDPETGLPKSGVLSAIYVYPYKANDIKDEDRDTTNTKVLLFAASNVKNPNGETVFLKNCFYEIPSGTNIFNLTPAKAESYKIGESNPNNAAAMDSVKAKFKEKKYPEISFDIAFAKKTQLSHLVSGETQGWTVNGIMQEGSDGDDFNEGYAVCLYVNDTDKNGEIHRSANRILIAAAENSGRVFNVRNDTTFTTRYLSIDASSIQQGSDGVQLTIYNLGQNEAFEDKQIKYLADNYGFDLDTTAYSSKTLQIDYERNTTIRLADNRSSNVLPQVCRYSDGADLFVDTMEELMTPYTTAEVERLRSSVTSGLRSVVSTIRSVDRYVRFSAETDASGNVDNSIDLHANNEMVYEIFANYVYFDNSVASISVTRSEGYAIFLEGMLFDKTDIIFNTQERGYNANEYISFFSTPSAEAYSGTLIRVESDIKVTYMKKHDSLLGDTWEKDSGGTLSAGYYYINAREEPDGVGLSELIKDLEDYEKEKDNGYKYKYYIGKTPEMLKDYEAAINPDRSNAFVDSGLHGGTYGAAQGFSGGTVQ